MYIFYKYLIIASVLQAYKIQTLINYKEIVIKFYKRNSNQCEVSFFSLTISFETEKQHYKYATHAQREENSIYILLILGTRKLILGCRCHSQCGILAKKIDNFILIFITH